ncbi:hypothetical protein [Streptococcus dysgalactiae]|uniref:Muscle M-line assembly protein unc-89 n=1 Tax=Streptococcus dysgalactiae subsp. equisimilis TaxID=119602 RepID=A0A9X8T461_STREQ|nr:hypothetical protein [Streptococcus dysgalactiae]GET74781.1 hypothetical protein KNZ06_12380 [Streptococcus dysgalactiae subsp. equisimilis]SUN64618.1 Muscle M-line assembly protein unc-89 [Streptococcus dysgalactiae subsp. equisimilis]VTS97234.1 Muscle M-line assembly protein unc-89 [Streptococcus dysgalactiae subsp. equisimilis]
MTGEDFVNQAKDLDPKLQRIILDKIERVFRTNAGRSKEELLPLIKIDLENNLFTYPHDDHSHMEPIDASKPFGNGDKIYDFVDYNLPGKPELEKHDVIGPIFTNTNSSRDLDKKKLLETHPELKEQILDINSFYALSFLAQDSGGQEGYIKQPGSLRVGSQETQAVTYLIKKGQTINNLKIEVPTPLAKEQYFFKKWSSQLPTDGKLEKDLVLTAAFRHDKHKNTQAFFTGDPKDLDVNIGDYSVVNFTTLNHGKLNYKGNSLAGFSFRVRNDLTWKNVLDSGFIFPTPVPNDDNIEFIRWGGSVDFPEGAAVNNKVEASIFLAKFGLKRPIIGAYVPSDAKNPTKADDPKRLHPNSVTDPYDESKYMTIVIDAGEHATLRTHSTESRQLAFVVRQGTTWDEFAKTLVNVAVIPEKGYVYKGHDLALSKGSDKVQPGVYKEIVVEQESDKDKKPSQDNWLDEFTKAEDKDTPEKTDGAKPGKEAEAEKPAGPKSKTNSPEKADKEPQNATPISPSTDQEKPNKWHLGDDEPVSGEPAPLPPVSEEDGDDLLP